jgi:hypothetical protein
MQRDAPAVRPHCSQLDAWPGSPQTAKRRRTNLRLGPAGRQRVLAQLRLAALVPPGGGLAQLPHPRRALEGRRFCSCSFLLLALPLRLVYDVPPGVRRLLHQGHLRRRYQGTSRRLTFQMAGSAAWP